MDISPYITDAKLLSNTAGGGGALSKDMRNYVGICQRAASPHLE